MGSKILVVDDDRDTQVMVSMLLTDAGYEAITAGTLQAAIDSLAKDQPDLLITDVRLHGYNGLQLIATAQTAIPAIVVTGHRDRVIEAEARRMGAEYLVKPVVPLRLLLAVREKLGGIPCMSRQAAPRRWDRKPLSPTLLARAGGVPLNIVDVSHGGLRFEIERVPGQFLPLSFHLAMPDNDLRIGIDVVWKERREGIRWICGAEVSDNRPRWRELVDSLSQSQAESSALASPVR